MLIPEGYKNTNQQFQDKYKKKATRKDLQEIKTSISQKKKKILGKCSCFSTRQTQLILQQNLPMTFHIAVGKSTLVTTFERDNGFSTAVSPGVSVTNALRDNSFGRSKVGG